MRIYRSILGYAFAALACFGFSGMAFATESPTYFAYSFGKVLKDTGKFGAESAKFKAEQTYMVSLDAVSLTTTGLLARESNGYRLAELVNVAVNGSEVAKGKVGVGPSAVA